MPRPVSQELLACKVALQQPHLLRDTLLPVFVVFRQLSNHMRLCLQMNLLDRAIKLAAEQDEPEEMNFVRKHARQQVGRCALDLHGQWLLPCVRAARHPPRSVLCSSHCTCTALHQAHRSPCHVLSLTACALLAQHLCTYKLHLVQAEEISISLQLP